MIMAAFCFVIGVFIGVSLASVAAAGKKRDKPLADTTVPVEKFPGWEKVEYITKEQGMAAACKALCCPGPRCPDTPCVEVEYVFRAVPAADVRPVVHGRWIPIMMSEATGWDLSLTGGRDAVCECRCSTCGDVAKVDEFGNDILSDFCPHCGADMRERREQDDEEMR